MGGLVDRAGGADHDRVWGGGVMLDGEAPWQEAQVAQQPETTSAPEAASLSSTRCQVGTAW